MRGIIHNNINYPLSDALALYESGMVLGEKKFQEKAAELAKIALGQASENGLLVGEGVPWTQRSKGLQSCGYWIQCGRNDSDVSSFMAD